MSDKILLGWREWIALPELGIDRIKAKVDTGARTSALHAFELEEIANGALIRFAVHPIQRDDSTVVWCEAPQVDRRSVRDSGGHEEERPVIRSTIRLGTAEIEAELTLTSRDNMGFRMLIGRSAIRDQYAVDPGKSYVLDKESPR